MFKVRTKTLNMQKAERIRRVGDTVDLPLFDGGSEQPTYRHNDGVDERNAAHTSVKDVNGKEKEVLDVIYRSGPVTDLQIADVLGWKINQVTGRRNGLLAKKLIVKHGSIRNQETGKMNSLWRIA